MARYSAQGTVTIRRRPADGRNGDKGADGENAWSVECSPSTVTVDRTAGGTVKVRITSMYGTTALPYGGNTSLNFQFQNSINGVGNGAGVIDGWIAWSFTQEDKAFILTLVCAPKGVAKTSDLTCTINLYKNNSKISTKTINILVNTYANGTNGAQGPQGIQGPQGSPGPSGLIYRKTEWRPNTDYSNDKSQLGKQDYCYLDIVYRTGDDGQVKGVWECATSHTSSTDSPPWSETYDANGLSASGRWKKVNIMKPIYTSLLLAEGAVIGFMQGNRLKIYDENGNLKAGISAATGDYPIFYANPQKYPTQVNVFYGVTTSTIAQNASPTWISNTAITSSSPLTLNNNAYIHFRYDIIWNDNTITQVYRRNLQNTTGSQLKATAPMPITFASTKANNSTEANNAVLKNTPCTSVAKPYLWINAELGSKNYGRYQIAKQSAGGEDSTRAMFQVRETGDITLGMPTAARLNLVAAPADGLPRMDIYDESGDISAIFDGSKVTQATELYGSGTATASLNGSLSSYSSEGKDGTEADFVTVSSEQTTQITVEKDSVLTTSASSLSMSTVFYNGSGYDTGQSAEYHLSIGNVEISSGYMRYPSSSATFVIPARSIALSNGTHTIKLQLIYKGQRGDGTCKANCSLNSTINFTASYGRQMCRYFSNGFAIGSSTNNYCMVWNANGVMNFIVENSSYGLKVTSGGVYVKKPSNTTSDKWSAL